jgi:Zn-finger nucleic acid-binding protein
MDALQRAGAALDRCQRCSVIWFDTLELDRVLKSERSIREYLAYYDVPFRRDSDPLLIACPRCQTRTLDQGRVGAVPTHRCSHCGGFLVKEGDIKSIALRGTSAIARSVSMESRGASARAEGDFLEFLMRLFTDN